jgi:ATP-dependent Clp protease ATP-binding subunit ClpA
VAQQAQSVVSQPGQYVANQLGKELDLYSERAGASLGLAEREARSFNHNYVGTEHLLLGLLAVEDGVGARALGNLDIRPETVRQAVVDYVGRGTDPVTEEIGLAPRARNALTHAREEARQLGHHYVGTEHILLGLLHEGEGVAAGILVNRGVDLEAARAEVVRVLGAQAKGNVITCRIWPRDLEAIDLLIEAGIRNTRSDAAAWLIHAGIEGNRELFERVRATVADIRRLRQQAQDIARELGGSGSQPSGSRAKASETSPRKAPGVDTAEPSG